MKRILLGLITLIFLGSGFAYAAEPYTNSAHGSSTSGVERTDYPTALEPYAQGSCAHCHEQHASIGGTEPTPNTLDAAGPDKFCLLANNFDTAVTAGTYAQDDNACFYCHYGQGTYQATAFYNYSYSITFGGNTDSTPATIFDAFNSTSYHNLNDVLNFAKGKWPTFSADSNPCSACHNPHLAKRNKVNPGNPAYTAISKPSAHDELWGDDDTEGMDNYSSFTYQAPYYYAVTPTNYEPANNATSDGSNLPNYAAFCLDCHVNAVPKSVGVPAKAINWVTTDQHGQSAAGSETDHGELKAPYVNANSGDYALSCTDCHEPHGSSNEWLLRTEVNAKKDISITTPGVWYEFCTACHSVVLGGTGSHSSVTSESSSCSSTDNSCHKHGAQF